MNSLAMADIRLTQNKDALAKLRRLGRLKKDEYGERFDAMFDSNPIPFWIGQVRNIPENWVDGLVDSFLMPIDAPCKNCSKNVKDDKGRTERQSDGYLVGGGECPKCKGTGWADTNVIAPLFKKLTVTDPLLLNPASYQAPPMKEVVSTEPVIAP